MADIEHTSLLEFLRKNAAREGHFAEFTFKCGASDLVEMHNEIDWEKDRSVTKYRFRESIKVAERAFRSYSVLYIPNSAYLVYRKSDELQI